MKTKGTVKAMVMAMLVAMMLVTACAKNERGRSGKGQGPPPEAISACENSQKGDKVTFAGRDGESLSGTCQSIDGKLAAVPEGNKPRQ